MSQDQTRSLTQAETAHIAGVFQQLRDHFHAWPCLNGGEYHLMQFAYYEGCGHRWECCRQLLAEAAPFALGQELAAKHGFEWVMLRAGGEWHYAVRHTLLAQPIDLTSLEDGSLNEQEYDEPPCPGRMTVDSLETITGRLEGEAGKRR